MQLDDEIMEKRLLPCEIMIYDILHLGNRTTERIVKVLFTLGADTISNSMASYQTSVEAIVNSKEFRFKNNNSSAEETQARNGRRWKFPTGESGETVGEVKMSGREATKFIDKIHLLYEVCLGRSPSRDLLINCVNTYKDSMVILSKKDDFTDEELEELQMKIDDFSRKWMQCTAEGGCMNYFHGFICGHVMYFARKYRNYYRYSQEGWEAINSRIKLHYSCHTQKGGNDSGIIKPIYQYIQRSIAWRNGLGDQFFEPQVRNEDSDDDRNDESYNLLDSTMLNAEITFTLHDEDSTD